jgi:outer membrane receptor protein involved in Fe transport
VVQAGLWAVEKQMKSFTDELRISREWLPNNTVTVGAYFANYTAADTWYLGSSHLMTATPNASLINVKLNNGVVVSNNGKEGPVFFAPNASYDGSNTAFYVSNEWKVNDRIKVDAGIRRERQKISGSVSNLVSGDTDNNLLTVYNNGTSMPSGAYTALGRKDTATSFTIGGNYKLTKDASIFARANSGHTFIAFDTLRNAGTQANVDDRNQNPTPTVKQFEVGFKTVGQLYSAYINAFHLEFRQRFQGHRPGIRSGGAPGPEPDVVADGRLSEIDVQGQSGYRGQTGTAPAETAIPLHADLPHPAG